MVDTHFRLSFLALDCTGLQGMAGEKRCLRRSSFPPGKRCREQAARAAALAVGRVGARRVAGRSVVMGRAVVRREAVGRAAVVGLEVNKAAVVEAAARVRVDSVKPVVRVVAVPRMTTKVVLVAVARVGVARKPR